MAEPDNSLGIGEYYDLEDYAGFGQRIAIILIDGVVLFCASVAICVTALVFMPVSEGPAFTAAIVFAWFYLTICKARRWNLAYRLLGLRIVTLKGKRPSVFRMSIRMTLWILGPFNFLTDLLWLGADSDQQSLRDCYVATCVVRATAEPIGKGPIHMAYYNTMGFNLMYPRVNRPRMKST